MSGDLAAFISARLDEKETANREIHEARVCSGCSDGWEAGFDPDRCDCGYPAQVLREVEAARKILAECDLLAKVGIAFPDEAGPESADRIMSLLAAIWSGHPDYIREG